MTNFIHYLFLRWSVNSCVPFVNNVYNFLFYLRILLGKDLENSSLTEIGQWFKCEMKVIHEGMTERKKRTKRMPN